VKIKITIEIPEGYRRLGDGEKIQAGDEFANGDADFWRPARAIGSFVVGQRPDRVYIRRAK
jgi:hypothetical protein